MYIKNLIFAFALVALAATSAAAQTQTTEVQGYQRSNGTLVAPSTRTRPNGTLNDNFNTVGNSNLRTGEMGTRPRDGEGNNSGISNGRVIETGPRGGQFTRDESGKKHYVR